MANWYINSVAYAAVAQWAASHTYAAGAIVRQLASVAAGAERCFRTSAGGVSGTTEPIWCTTQGGVTVGTDGTITDWTEVTGNQTYQAPGAWAAPLARLPQIGLNGAASPLSQGTGWAVNDLASINGGTFTQQAILKITAVSGGKPTGWVIYDPGVYSVVPPTGFTITAISPGIGTGAASTGLVPTIGAIRGATSDFYFVSSNHAETQASICAIALVSSVSRPAWVICVDESVSGAVPPTSANLKTTATISNTGAAANISWLGSFHSYGISFAHSATATGLYFAASAGLDEHQIIEQGSISCLATTGTVILGHKLIINVVAAGAKIEWINVSFFAGVAGNTIFLQSGNFSWRNSGSAAFKAGSAAPTAVISPSAATGVNAGGSIELDGLDFSSAAAGTILSNSATDLSYSVIVRNCKLAGGTVLNLGFSSPSFEMYNYNTDSGNTNYKSEKYTYRGSETTEVSVTRVGGASDGVTPQSRKIATNPNATSAAPFRSMPMMIWNDLVGSTRNFTLFGTINAGSPPANNELWLEVEYFEDASSPLASFIDNKMLYLGTPAAQTADNASTWNGGGSGAGWSPFSLTVSFTAQQHGYIVARIVAAKVSTTYYIDPPGAGTLT